MENGECVLCKSHPNSALYVKEIVVSCTCRNTIKVLITPAIYLGIFDKKHICIIPFPGCVVCGRAMNTPWTIGLLCHNEEEQHLKFQEVYHNHGLRN